MRKFMAFTVVAFCSLLPAIRLAAEEWGDLSVSFTYAGDAPEAAKLAVTTDKAFCGQFPILDESLVVNSENKGVANVVAYLYIGRGDEVPKAHPSYADAAENKIMLDNNECRFDPHIALLRTSQTLVIGNSDKVGHNCKVDTFVNTPFNYTIPAGGKHEHTFGEVERLPVRVSCSIHPWMSGWLLVKDHPYMAVSDADGKLQIKNLPVGRWTIQFWHEKSGYVSDVSKDGQATEWPRGRLEVEIKSGDNDLGSFQLPPSLFTN